MKSKFYSDIIIYTVLSFLPLSCYEFPIGGITYGDFILFITLLLIVLKTIKDGKIIIKNKNIKFIFFYLAFVTLSSILSYFITQSITILSFFRYLLYIIWCVFAATITIDTDKLFKKYQTFGSFFAIYAIAQTILFSLNNYILPADPLKGILGNSFVRYYNEANIHYYTSKQLEFRAYSLFLEPSYFAMYQMPLLLFLCNKKNRNKKEWYSIILIIISMFCGRTITGIGLSLVILFISFFYKSFKTKKGLLAFLLLIISFFIFSQTEYFQKILSLVITEDGLGYSLNNRIGNYSYIFTNSSSLSLMFGKGLWFDTDYLPSIGRIIVSYGIIGLLILSLYFVFVYSKLENYNKKLLLMFVFSLIGTNSLFNITFVMCFILIFCSKRKDGTNDM